MKTKNLTLDLIIEVLGEPENSQAMNTFGSVQCAKTQVEIT